MNDGRARKKKKKRPKKRDRRRKDGAAPCFKPRWRTPAILLLALVTCHSYNENYLVPITPSPPVFGDGTGIGGRRDDLHPFVSFMLCSTPTLYFQCFALGSYGLRVLFFVCREIEYWFLAWDCSGVRYTDYRPTGKLSERETAWLIFGISNLPRWHVGCLARGSPWSYPRIITWPLEDTNTFQACGELGKANRIYFPC